MSRYTAHCSKDGSSITYGFDDCGLPGYFIDDAIGNSWDTRPFMAETSDDEYDDDRDPCGGVMTRGKMVEFLEFHREAGFDIPYDHVMKMALDLPF